MTQNQLKETKDVLKFTRLCKYWTANRCHLGTECNFAHSETELRDQPDLVGTRLCFQFARKGVCKNGDACTFAHGKSQLRRAKGTQNRQSPQGPPQSPPQAEQVSQPARDARAVEELHGLAVTSKASISMLMALKAQQGQEHLMAPSAPAFPVAHLHNLQALRQPMPSMDLPAVPLRPPPGLEDMASPCLSPCLSPPGLDFSGYGAAGAAGTPDPRLFAEMLREGLESSRRKGLQKQDSLEFEDSLGLPLSLEPQTRASSKSSKAGNGGTESTASTSWLSGYPSDISEPASPKSAAFWF